MVEQSAAAEFLVDTYLSARHVGIEFGGKFQNKVAFAMNYSNGAGEGGREDAGRTKSDVINNGKLIPARINVPVGQVIEIGVSYALNKLGRKQGSLNDTGNVYAIAPDFGIYLPSNIDIEGGMAIGSISKDFAGGENDEGFFLETFEKVVSFKWANFII